MSNQAKHKAVKIKLAKIKSQVKHSTYLVCLQAALKLQGIISDEELEIHLDNLIAMLGK